MSRARSAAAERQRCAMRADAAACHAMPMRKMSER